MAALTAAGDQVEFLDARGRKRRLTVIEAQAGACTCHADRTAKDRNDPDFVVRHADMVALSFVQRATDVEELIAELHARNAAKVGIVLKIETRQAFDHLPALILAAMRHPLAAVMVARGDLGVEVGFERLAEVQEEILWLCEAAHVPVIWATRVLESLARNGLSPRAEVTDAAMSGRAEGVMLNKGPFILQALSFLAAVVHRMQAHQSKKTATLRRLRVSDLEIRYGLPRPGARLPDSFSGCYRTICRGRSQITGSGPTSIACGSPSVALPGFWPTSVWRHMHGNRTQTAH